MTPRQIPRAYTRLYTDADGHSRFEDVNVEGETKTVQESALVATLAEPVAARELIFRNVLSEAGEEPHNAPRRQFIVQLSGTCEVETSTGDVRRFGPGSFLLVEDVDGRGHITRAVDGGPRLTALITLPDEG